MKQESYLEMLPLSLKPMEDLRSSLGDRNIRPWPPDEEEDGLILESTPPEVS